MGLLKPALILVLLASTLLYTEALATDPPPRVGAVKDAGRSEPPQPRPKAGTDPQDMSRAGEAEAAARAREREKEQDKAGAAQAGIKTDDKGHPVKPLEPPAVRKKPVKRRAVAARLDDGMLPPSYAPRLAPAPQPAPLPPGPLAVPSGPVILNGCPNGHCSDASGQRYNPVGTTLISPQGRLCSNNGISVSCY